MHKYTIHWKSYIQRSTTRPKEAAYTSRLHKVEEISIATLDDEHIGTFSELILHSWPLTRPEVQKDP